jgi:hypothetical protein
MKMFRILLKINDKCYQLQGKDKRKKQTIHSIEKMAEPTRKDNNTKLNSRGNERILTALKPLVKI